MRRIRLPLVLLAAVALHQSLFAFGGVGDARPDLMLLVAVAGGMAAGPERGAVIGFAAGLAADVFLATPFGLSALAFSLVAFAVGTLQAAIIRSAWWIAPVTTFAATSAGLVLYALLGAILGHAEYVGPELLAVAAGAGLANAVLSVPVVRAMRWAAAGASPRAVAA